ncbi:MAG: lipopolysaccharide heptosyltransferase II [Candidatus Ancaeobacter aquaticus]|nr:lipopolysaccharide heptosyltransferase II [Candidatus Ancaeobacter aquaticus]
MKILQMVPELECGGVETGTVDLALMLKERGHIPYVITSGGSMVAKLESSQVTCIKLPVHKKSIISIIGTIFKVRKIVREEDIDIVHARSRVPGWIGYFAVQGTHAHFVTTAHGYYSTHFASRVMGRGEKVIVPSAVISEHMENDFGVVKDKLVLIPRGVDVRKFREKEPELGGIKDTYNIGVIGRLTPIKGHSYVIRALTIILRSFPHVKLFIIGDAYGKKVHYKDELIRLVEELGLKDNIVFTGACSDVSKILDNLDIVILSSIVPEAFGRVITEAFAACVPVIATRLGGALDIIDDKKNGLLVEPKDENAIAEAVTTLFQDHKLCEKIIKNALEKVHSEYTLEKMYERTCQVYEECVNTKKILIVKLSALGDIVLISPSVRAIKKKYPYAKITALTSSRYKGLFKKSRDIHHVLTYDKGNNPLALMKLIRKLRHYRFDIAVDFQNTYRTHLILFFGWIKKSIGYKRKCGFLMSESVDMPTTPMDPVSHQFKLLSVLDIPLENRQIEFWTGEEDKRAVKKIFRANNINEDETLIAINPGGSHKWKSKRWPRERFAELINVLYERYQARTVLIGGNDLSEYKDYFKQNLSVPYIDTIGLTSISEAGELLKRCKLLVTGDSAPLHIAAGCAVPFVALFGPTDPHKHMPIAKGTVITKNVECSPCVKNTCGEHICMENITVSDVLEKVAQYI